MARYKSLLKTHQMEFAKRKRKCKHDSTHIISKGEKCLVIYEDGKRRSVYCGMCASAIITIAESSLFELNKEVLQASHKK